MARRDRRADTGAELRAFLLAEAKSVLAVLLGHEWPLAEHSSYKPTPQEIAEWPLGGPVAALAEGKAHRLHRRDLPPDHPARRVGDLGDYMVLTEANELVEE